MLPMGSSRKKSFCVFFIDCFGEEPLCSFLLPRWEDRLIDQFDKENTFVFQQFSQMSLWRLDFSQQDVHYMLLVISLLVTGYHNDDDSTGLGKMLASSYPLGEVEDATCAATEGIRGVLETSLFMLMVPGMAEKAAFCSWRGRNGTGREKEGDACVCLLWSKCTLFMVLSDFFYQMYWILQ